MPRKIFRQKGQWYLLLSALSLSIVLIFQNCAKGVQSQLTSGASSGSSSTLNTSNDGARDGSGVVSPISDEIINYSEKITTAFIVPSQGQGTPIIPSEITTAFRLGDSLMILDKTHFYEWSYKTGLFTPLHYDSSVGGTVFNLGLSADQTTLGGRRNAISEFWDPDPNAPHGSEVADLKMSVDWPGTSWIIYWTKANWYIFDKSKGRFLTIAETFPHLSDRSLAKMKEIMPADSKSNAPRDFEKITTAVVLNDVIHILDDQFVYRYVPPSTALANPNLAQYSDKFMPPLKLSDVWGADPQAPKVYKDITHSYLLDFQGEKDDLIIFNTTTEGFAFSKSRNRFLVPSEIDPRLGNDHSLRRIWNYTLGVWGELSYANLSSKDIWSGLSIAEAFRQLRELDSTRNVDALYPDSKKIVGSFPWRDHIFFIDSDGRFFAFNLRQWRFQSAGELDPGKFGSGNSNNYLSVAWKGLQAPTKIQLIFQLGRVIYMVDPQLKIFALDTDSSNFLPLKTIVPNIAGETVLDFFKAKGVTDTSLLEEIKKFRVAFPHKGGIRFLTQTKWFHFDIATERFSIPRVIEPDFPDELLSRVMRCDDPGMPKGLCRQSQ